MSLDHIMLRVYDAGYPNGLRFAAVIGHPDVIRVAHHRHARGITVLLAEDEIRSEPLWETRAYVLAEIDQDGAWARYEPQGWETMSDEEIHRREAMLHPTAQTHVMSVIAMGDLPGARARPRA